MKPFFTILKYLLLATLLIGLAFGFIFFRVWQENASPEITESAWSQEEVLLGHDATLDLTITAPWHREIVSALPTSSPDFLAPIFQKARFEKGPLNLTGQRTWIVTVPFVATDTKSLDGLTATFPFKGTKRVSPNSVTLALPPLTIITPAEIPDTPRDPNQFLTEEKPPEEPEPDSPKADPTRSPWLWALLALLAIPFIIYFLRRTGLIKTTPPWEKALARLDQLDPQTAPIVFYSRLSDILKSYTSDRYTIRGRSKTSAEFIQILRNHPEIPKKHLDDLTGFAKLADAVKFADYNPEATSAPSSLALIRSFVNDTTPQDPEAKPQNSDA